MSAWVALLGTERSDQDLTEARTKSAETWSIETFTCDECPAKKTCEYAFDPYNTNDDCLAEK